MGGIGTREGRFWPCVFEPGQARKKSILPHNWWMLCRSDFLKMAASLLSISGASTLEASGRQMDGQCAISFLTLVCLMCLWDFGIWLIAFSRWVHISLRVAMHLSKPYIPAFPVQKKKKGGKNVNVGIRQDQVLNCEQVACALLSSSEKGKTVSSSRRDR